MRSIKKRFIPLVLTVIVLALLLSGCNAENGYIGFEIVSRDEITLEVGDEIQLETLGADNTELIVWSSSGECVSVSDEGLIKAVSEGEAVITAEYESSYDTVLVVVIGDDMPPEEELPSGGKNPPSDIMPPEMETPSDDDIPSKDDTNGGQETPPEDEKTPEFDDVLPTFDPYVGVTKEEFYSDYRPATNYVDAYYRTQHCFMSGSILSQDQAPTVSLYRPMLDGMYIKNTSSYYDDDGNTYYIVDAYGEIVGAVFKDGAYVSLEEVAAYVYAFGTVPPNYISKKNANPTKYGWGEYLRLNHSKFSGDTSRYPYEPVLPNISGCGGDLQYYEIDVGTTGTDCDPEYESKVYNDGYEITRGAARIVYTMYDEDGSGIVEIDEHYLFYTYNHYNDFQEYLNYEGGWGEMFGNITGGGSISSRYDYNPTPYVEVAYSEFAEDCEDKVVAYIFKEEIFSLCA